MHLTKPSGIKYFVENLDQCRRIQSLFDVIFDDGPYTSTHGTFTKQLPKKTYVAGEGDVFVLDKSYFPNGPVTVLL